MLPDTRWRDAAREALHGAKFHVVPNRLATGLVFAPPSRLAPAKAHARLTAVGFVSVNALAGCTGSASTSYPSAFVVPACLRAAVPFAYLAAHDDEWWLPLWAAVCWPADAHALLAAAALLPAAVDARAVHAAYALGGCEAARLALGALVHNGWR